MIDLATVQRVEMARASLRSKLETVHPDDIGDGLRNKIIDLLIAVTELLNSILHEHHPSGEDEQSPVLRPSARRALGDEPHGVSNEVGWPGGKVSESAKREWDSEVTTLVRLMIAYGEHVSGWASLGGTEVLTLVRGLYGSDFVSEAQEVGFDDLRDLRDLRLSLEGSDPTVRNAPARATAEQDFQRCEAGQFLMGSSQVYKTPPHEVVISRPFLLQVTPVTQGQFTELMGVNPSHFPELSSTHPVEHVSWWDAVAYCNALSRAEGLEECYELTGASGTVGKDFGCKAIRFKGLSCPGYRLPTEAEWEYACRAGTNEPYGVLDEIAWYLNNSCGGTHSVKGKLPNAWGLYDMHGNVWEWCWDWYEQPPTGPQCDPMGPDDGLHRVLRGGAWFAVASFLRAPYRFGYAPSDRYGSLGFRCARSLPGRTQATTMKPHWQEELRGTMKYKSEESICKDALSIVEGACNLRGVAHTMCEMVQWLQDAYGTTEGHPDNRYAGGVHPDKHPAIRLCMSQLCVITGSEPSGDVKGFSESYRYCQEKVKETQP